MKSTLRAYPPNFTLVICVIFLLGIGLISIYSASGVYALERFGSSTYFLVRQSIWMIMGLCSTVFFSFQNMQRLKKWTYPLLIIVFISLVTIFFVGHTVGGANRWLRFGGLGFQPSELAKLSLVLFVAYYCDKKKSKLNNFYKGVLPLLLIVSLFCGLIFIQPDLGTPLIIFATCITMIFIAGGNIKQIVQLGCILILLAGLAVWFEPYRRKRLLSFLNPWDDPLGSSYQLVQSLIAIGSGGLMGVGLGNSHSKLLYLPEPHTDFIFPIISEELGLLGAWSIIILFIILTWCGFKIASKTKDFYSSLLASGIVFLILYQVIFNIAMVTGCVPTKGLPLPFVSFGGSSLVITLSAVGILLNISRNVERS